MINLYDVSREILKTHLTLNSIAYESFSHMRHEERIKLNTMLQSLSLLAKKIEQYADEQFNHEEK